MYEDWKKTELQNFRRKKTGSYHSYYFKDYDGSNVFCYDKYEATYVSTDGKIYAVFSCVDEEDVEYTYWLTQRNQYWFNPSNQFVYFL